MDNDQIIHLTAKQLFCCIIDRNASVGVDVMMRTISMGPDASLRFLGELSNTVDQFRAYLTDCAKYGISGVRDLDCVLTRFCDSLKNGDTMIKVGDWEDHQN